MSEWTRTKTLQHGPCTINLHRPVLTAAERTKRESRTKETLERVMRDYLHKKEATP